MTGTTVVIAVLAACAAALVIGASLGEQGGDAASAPRAGAPITMADAAAGPGLRYAGPRRVSGRSTLHAQVRRGSARTVAVTFLLDGEPLGTDTTPPFALDVEAGLLPPGRHRLRLAAVDALGRRVQSRAVRVQVGAPSAASSPPRPRRASTRR